jgi:pimeloyl-ACP methyl ester carboxylesterase
MTNLPASIREGLVRYKIPALTVAGLALAAVVNVALARRAERHHPPRGKFIEVDGTLLHYLDRGRGTPIVLLHGNGAMAEDFAAAGIIDALARDYRVIAFDRPGFGHSDRPRNQVWTADAQAKLLAEALRQLGVERPVLVGHSWGTLVALEMALEHCRDAAAVVLLSGYYTPTPRADVAILSWGAAPWLGDVLRYTIWPLVSRATMPLFLRRAFGPAAVDERFAAGFPFELAYRPSQIRATAGDTALMILGAVRLQGRYGDLDMPVAIMAGADDRIVMTDHQLGRLEEQIPDCRLEVLPGVGHMIHYTAGDEVIDTIRSIAGETEPLEASARRPEESLVE